MPPPCIAGVAGAVVTPLGLGTYTTDSTEDGYFISDFKNNMNRLSEKVMLRL